MVLKSGPALVTNRPPTYSPGHLFGLRPTKRVRTAVTPANPVVPSLDTGSAAAPQSASAAGQPLFPSVRDPATRGRNPVLLETSRFAGNRGRGKAFNPLLPEGLTKADHVALATSLPHPFQAPCPLDKDLQHAIHWTASNDPAVVNAWRLSEMIRYTSIAESLKPASEALWDAGDQAVRKISGHINVAFVQRMIDDLKWPDTQLPHDLLNGSNLLGPLQNFGIWPPARPGTDTPQMQVDEFLAQLKSFNLASIRRMKPSDSDEALWRVTSVEIDRGFLGPPIAIAELQLDRVILVPRFPVFQGKVRPIDDFKACHINETHATSERLTVESLDHGVSVIRLFADAGVSPGKMSGWTADEWNAYKQRAPPGREQDIYYILYNHPERGLVCSQMFAMPFGAAASVLQFNRLPKLMTAWARRVLRAPMLSYFDDFYGIEPDSTAATGYQACVRVHDLVGVHLAEPEWPPPFQDRARKPPKVQRPTKKFVLLGVLLDLVKWNAQNTPERVEKYSELIDTVLASNRLTSAEASSLRSKLQFAAGQFWGKTGRYALRMLSARQYRADGSSTGISQRLGDALVFLRKLLRDGEPRPLPRLRNEVPPVVIYTDATGLGGIGAVIFAPGSEPRGFSALLSTDFVAHFMASTGNRIQPLEALVPVLAVLNFRALLKGRQITWYQDNTGAEAALSNGHSQCSFTNTLVGVFWELSRAARLQSWLERVDSSANIADIPSREYRKARLDLSGHGIPRVSWVQPFVPKMSNIFEPARQSGDWSADVSAETIANDLGNLCDRFFEQS